ncbi:MAG: response regulator [Armatimonadota bacterium]
MQNLSPVAKLYLGVWYAAGAGTIVAVALVSPPTRWQELIWLLALSGLFSSHKIRIASFPIGSRAGERAAQLSVGSTITFATLFMLGTGAAVIVDAFGTLCESIYPQKKRWYVAVFNISSLAAITLASGYLYQALGGNVGDDWLSVDLRHPERLGLLAALSSVLLYFALNTLSVAVIVSLVNQQSVLRMWAENWLWSLPCFVAAGSTALGFALAYAWAPAVAFLVLPLVVVIALAYDFYQGRMEEQARRVTELEEKRKELYELYTQLTHSEAQLRESEARYRAVVEDQMELIARSLPDGTLTFVNEACCRFFGKTREQLLGRNVAELLGQDEIASRQLLGQQLSPQNPSRSIQKSIEVSPGDVRWLHWIDRGIFKEDGQLCEIQSVGRDVTEQVALEEQLRQAQKMEAVGRLAGGVAHDFNNLLMAMTGYADLLLRAMPQNDPHRRYVGEIQKAAQRAAALTQQLLAFSRKQILSPKILDLNTSVIDIERMLSRLIGEDVELITDLAPDLGLVKADPHQIDQVILNLVVNARDAMPEGGKLIIRTGNVYLNEQFARTHPDAVPGEYVMLSVTDTGCGMYADTLSLVFEPFFTTKPTGKGTGLGLSTVYGIVRQSGGYIDVESEVGKGSTFRIYLPRVTEASTDRSANNPYDDLPGGSETVLLVEDEDTVRSVVRGALQSSGYTVLEASNGEDALAVCSRHEGPVHLVVTDVVMPGMSGRELVERLTERIPNLRVLYMSGHTDDSVLRRGVMAGGGAFLQKPFSAEVLVRKVREVLDAPLDKRDGNGRNGHGAE